MPNENYQAQQDYHFNGSLSESGKPASYSISFPKSDKTSTSNATRINYGPPSNTVFGAIHRIDESVEKSLNILIPVVVTKWYAQYHRVKVRPLIMSPFRAVGTGRLDYLQSSEFEVPYQTHAHGGFQVEWPYFAGDTGWVIAGDIPSGINNPRVEKQLENDEDDVSDIMQEPEHFGYNEFSYGLFIPHQFGEYGYQVHKSRYSIASAVSIMTPVSSGLGIEDERLGIFATAGGNDIFDMFYEEYLNNNTCGIGFDSGSLHLRTEGKYYDSEYYRQFDDVKFEADGEDENDSTVDEDGFNKDTNDIDREVKDGYTGYEKYNSDCRITGGSIVAKAVYEKAQYENLKDRAKNIISRTVEVRIGAEDTAGNVGDPGLFHYSITDRKVEGENSDTIERTGDLDNMRFSKTKRSVNEKGEKTISTSEQYSISFISPAYYGYEKRHGDYIDKTTLWLDITGPNLTQSRQYAQSVANENDERDTKSWENRFSASIVDGHCRLIKDFCKQRIKPKKEEVSDEINAELDNEDVNPNDYNYDRRLESVDRGDVTCFRQTHNHITGDNDIFGSDSDQTITINCNQFGYHDSKKGIFSMTGFDSVVLNGNVTIDVPDVRSINCEGMCPVAYEQ